MVAVALVAWSSILRFVSQEISGNFPRNFSKHCSAENLKKTGPVGLNIDTHVNNFNYEQQQ